VNQAGVRDDVMRQIVLLHPVPRERVQKTAFEFVRRRKTTLR
jgi:hypothetical protein